MVFEVTYKKTDANSEHVRQSCFLEKKTPPDGKELIELLDRLSPGTYREESIKVQICSDFDARVLRHLEIPIYRLASVAGEAQPPLTA
jgi:hypothetical protein